MTWILVTSPLIVMNITPFYSLMTQHIESVQENPDRDNQETQDSTRWHSIERAYILFDENDDNLKEM